MRNRDPPAAFVSDRSKREIDRCAHFAGTERATSGSIPFPTRRSNIHATRSPDSLSDEQALVLRPGG